MTRYKRYRHRRHFRPRHKNYRRKQNPILIGVILIIAALILFRLSFTNDFLNNSEVFMWSIILSIGLLIAGFLIIVAWWRNNVSMFTTRHSVRWK